MLELKGRRVLVLGLGDTGLSMTRWLAHHGAEVQVADTRSDPPHLGRLRSELPQVSVVAGSAGAQEMARADLIAISPGVDRRQPFVCEAIHRGTPVLGDVELFARALEQLAPAPRVLAVTGTNGKSTVTAMAGAMCRAAGRATVVAGNIGLPVLDALMTAGQEDPAPEVFVLELSSFQLESTASLRPDAAAMLNLSEDHLDRYDSMTQYAAAKARIFAGDGAQVLNRDDPGSMAMARPGRVISTFGLGAPGDASQWGVLDDGGGPALARGDRSLLMLEDLPVAGLHNAANALAALGLAHALDLPEPPLLEALRGFKGLPHRLEEVAIAGGVVFFDDSKGTNVGASVAALSGMTRPVVLIAGGDGKGQNFAPLAAAVRRCARAVVLIGRDAALIAQALAGAGCELIHAGDMDEAVRAAFRASHPGDAVLLSPACASYDMFRSYAHRGEVFAAAVRRLVEGLAP
jgi:UDP-N-acetylmuramoylalanine--D-glutamate ligase